MRTADELPGGVERVVAPNPGPLTLSGTNTYLVQSPAWVIDPGPPDDGHLERVWSAAEGRGGIAGIALTHRHLDHAGVAAALRERSGAPLAAAAAPASGTAFAEPDAGALDLDVCLSEGARFGPLEVIATPGHAADHLCFQLATILFSGDSILGEGSVFIPPERNALTSYLESLRKLENRSFTAIYPGHGPVVLDPRAKIAEYIHHRLDRERRLVQALDRGIRSRQDLLDAAWSEVPEELRPAAALTLAAHLDKLALEGRLPPDVESA
jgi:glyoxylase-like metal-dependent hydrolase (beta-lactamase superfamily II)